MYEVIKSVTDNENGIEARLAKIEDGYTVGVWDLDCEQYYPPLTLFKYSLENALEKAAARFDKIAK